MMPLCEVRAGISQQFGRKHEVHLTFLFTEHSKKRRTEKLNCTYERNTMVTGPQTPYLHEYSAVVSVKDGEEAFLIRSTIIVRDLPKLKHFHSTMA